MTTTRDLLAMALDQGVTYVSFNPTFPGVEVPAHLHRGQHLILKFSHYYDSSVDLTDDYIAQELVFQGRRYACHVPLAAVDAVKVDEHDFQPAPVPKGPRLRLIGDDDD